MDEIPKAVSGFSTSLGLGGFFPFDLLLVVGRASGGADLDCPLNLERGEDVMEVHVRFLDEDVAEADACLLDGTFFLGDFLAGDFFLVGDFLDGGSSLVW